MAVEEFAECYAAHIGTTVDAVIADVNQIGVDGIRNFLNWWRNLSDKDRELVGLIAQIGGALVVGILLKILTKAVGQVVGTALIAFLGGASWALLVSSFLACEDKLSA